jgi:hypothetical protein
MPTLHFTVLSKKMQLAKLYVRFSAGRGNDLLAFSQEYIDISEWDAKSESFFPGKILLQDDEDFLDKLWMLRKYIFRKFKAHRGELNREWLIGTIRAFQEEYDNSVNVSTLEVLHKK